MNPVKIGMLSRVDYGSPGFRKGLLDLAYKRFREAGVHFVILAGGLFAGRALKQQMPKKKEEHEAYFDELAKYLADVFPRVHHDSEIKTYLMVSPAYDGFIGEAAVSRLVALRKDIRLYPKAVERFPLKGMKKKIAVIVPVKAAWRADYASTPVDRVLKDELKRSTQLPADVYSTGCYGVYMNRPKGESSCEYFALPALNKPEEITATENQVGIVILEVNDSVRVTNISFKDEVSAERELIKAPAGLSDFEQKVFSCLRRGPSTPGIIEDDLHESRTKIVKALNKIAGIKRRGHPRVREDSKSGRYDFDLSWRQQHLQYAWHPPDEIKEDRIVGFACMHAGSVFTDYDFIVNELPKIILAENATALAAVGDLIQGLKHDLMLRDEVIACANNYTRQEKLAGDLLAKVLGKVFLARLDAKLGVAKPGDVRQLLEECLISLIYIAGNHDEWVKALGFEPLDKFRSVVVRRLQEIVESALAKRQLFTPAVMNIVEKKIIALEATDNRYNLASGLKVGLLHPHTGRAQTTTLRLQQSMSAVPDCHVVLIGNFHTATAMAFWDSRLGQRCGMQFGTLMHKSDFEFKKNKIVDFGIGCLRVRSRNGRILEVETVFCGVPKRKTFSNNDLLEAFEKKIGIL